MAALHSLHQKRLPIHWPVYQSCPTDLITQDRPGRSAISVEMLHEMGLGQAFGEHPIACRSPWLLQLWRELCRHQSSLHAKASYHMGGISLARPSSLLSCNCSVHSLQLLQIRQLQSSAKLCICRSQAWCRRGQPLCCCRHCMNTTGADLQLVPPATTVASVEAMAWRAGLSRLGRP